MAERSSLTEREGSGAVRGLLGGALMVALVALVTGWLASQAWSPTDEGVRAFRAVARGPAGAPWWVPAHYWSSFVLILATFVCSLLSFSTGDFRASRLRWWGTVLLLLGTVGMQITGNALPMDRHDVQTVVVEAGIAARTPMIGPSLSHFILDGPQATSATIAHWYQGHLLIFLPIFLLGMGLAAAGLLAPTRERKSITMPVALMPVMAMVALFVFVPSPTGAMARDLDFTEQGARPSWYVLPMHALLRLFDSLDPSLGWVGAGLFPGLAVLLALLAPRWARNMDDRSRNVLLFGGLGALAIITLAMGGSPAPISGEQPVPILATSGSEKPAPIDGVLAVKGNELFNKSCAGCHGQDGKGGNGPPAVTAVYKKHPNAGWYIEFIKNPQSQKPGSTMPGFPNLKEDELKALAEWLRQPKD